MNLKGQVRRPLPVTGMSRARQDGAAMTDADLAAERLRRIVQRADAALRGISRRERMVRRVALSLH